jgi:hypothetical protein
MKESFKVIWAATDFVFKFITWVIGASLVQYAAHETNNVVLTIIGLLMWLLLLVILTKVCGLLIIISPNTDLSGQASDWFSEKWYWRVISGVLSLGISVFIWWWCQSALRG